MTSRANSGDADRYCTRPALQTKRQRQCISLQFCTDLTTPISLLLPRHSRSRRRLLRRVSVAESPHTLKMFTVSPSNHLNLQKHFESSGRRFFPISGSGSRFRVRKARVSRCGSLVGGSGSTRTVIRSQKNTVEPAASPSKKRGGNESSTISSSSSSGGIDVRAMIRIRKKMKEKLTEKIEDQWEYFVNGIGHGISIRLISEEIDPGLCSSSTIQFSLIDFLWLLGFPYL